MSNAQNESKKAYNLKVTQLNEANDGQNSNNTRKITFRGETTVKGKKGDRTITRTVIAQGKAADQISDMLGQGNVLGLRCVFDRAPDNDDGSQGGEFLTVVDLPRAKAAA